MGTLLNRELSHLEFHARVLELATDAIHHRIVLSYEALAAEVGADSIVSSVLEVVPVPEIELSFRAA